MEIRGAIEFTLRTDTIAIEANTAAINDDSTAKVLVVAP